MMNDNDNRFGGIWDERWSGSQEKERVTILGKMMFGAKEKVIKSVMRDIQVRTVLEVGSGLGYTLQVFDELGYDCLGIDISPEAVAVCTKKGLNAAIMNVEEMYEQFDLVSCDGLLEHFLDFESIAKHLMRIARQYVLLIQPNHDSIVGKTLVYLSELLMGDKNVYEYNYRIMDFIGVFNEHDFIIVRNEKIFSDVFRLLLFEKKV